MGPFKISPLFLLLFWLCVDLANNASLSIYEQKKYKNLIQGQGLYSADDDVEILTADDFKRRLYGQRHAWLIEFYNSWCGFCQRFAPSWKALASDVRGWSDLIKIGAIDCSDDKNSLICREFDIMGYPTLRYFYEGYEEGLGMFGDDTAKGDDVHSHRRHLIRQIISEQKEGRGRMFPNLLSYSYSSTDYLFDSVAPGTKYVFLIFEDVDMTIGPEVALDLHTIPDIAIRYATHNNTELARNLGIKTLPYMVVLSDKRELHQFTSGLKTRESFGMAVKDFLKSKNMPIPAQKDNKKEIYTGKWIESNVPDMVDLMEARERVALQNRIKEMGDAVFQMDLETALRYSLKHEVGNVKNITGVKLHSLKAYLNVLAKYFPLGQRGRAFLADLKDKVSGRAHVEGKEIADFVSAAENETPQVFSAPMQWLGCRGSAPEFRGYPCGLWKMFHFLTIGAVENSPSARNVNPLEVLNAMLGYVKNFFGCADCSQHFQEMATEQRMEFVSTPDMAALWLWKAHNSANKRLAGDATEDPEAPKIQFPSPENCPTCRRPDQTWNQPEVLKYLKRVYGGSNVHYIGVDARVLDIVPEESTASSGASGIFRKIDASMCFILYVASFSLLVVLIRMFLKRGYRKKMYVHDLLGKV